MMICITYIRRLRVHLTQVLCTKPVHISVNDSFVSVRTERLKQQNAQFSLWWVDSDEIFSNCVQKTNLTSDQKTTSYSYGKNMLLVSQRFEELSKKNKNISLFICPDWWIVPVFGLCWYFDRFQQTMQHERLMEDFPKTTSCSLWFAKASLTMTDVFT